MSKTNDKYWLTAFKDQFANAQSFSSCVRYADVEGNGDNSLVIGTIDKKLKTFSGVKLIKEHQLLGVPVSVNALYLDESERGKKIQMCIAVATGAYVFVYVVDFAMSEFSSSIRTHHDQSHRYKRMRPFLKFMVRFELRKTPTHTYTRLEHNNRYRTRAFTRRKRRYGTRFAIPLVSRRTCRLRLSMLSLNFETLM